MRVSTRMRFLLSCVALLTLGFAPQAPQASPRPVVLLVHGRGHLNDDSATLRRVWKRDLDSALASVGGQKLQNEDVRLAWYADILDPASDSGCATLRNGSDSLGFGELAGGFLAALASTLPANESRDVRALLGDVMFVIDDAKRCAAERRVGRAIEAAAGGAENRPVIVVAYSLGSLVAYEYLRSRPAGSSARDVRLITIGSPLGNRDIREIFLGMDSLRAPAGVSSWDNIYDPDDVFASRIGDDVVAKSVRDLSAQDASTEDPHHIGRYLRDRAMGMALTQALTGRP
jgi:hypothetical protein